MKTYSGNKRKLTRLIFLSIVLFISINSVFAVENIHLISKQTIKQKITALNGFSWQYGFDIELQNHLVLVSVAVNLIPASGVSMVELSQVKPIWKKGIERIWNKQYALKTQSGDIYPIRIKISFRGPKFHHSVIVRPGKGRSDELNWNLRDSEQTVAHEFGHMLGAFDEYKRGANDPDSPIIDKTSIMASNPKTGKSYVRHLKNIQHWFIKNMGDSQVQLILLRINE